MHTLSITNSKANVSERISSGKIYNYEKYIQKLVE